MKFFKRKPGRVPNGNEPASTDRRIFLQGAVLAAPVAALATTPAASIIGGQAGTIQATELLTHARELFTGIGSDIPGIVKFFSALGIDSKEAFERTLLTEAAGASTPQEVLAFTKRFNVSLPSVCRDVPFAKMTFETLKNGLEFTYEAEHGEEHITGKAREIFAAVQSLQRMGFNNFREISTLKRGVFNPTIKRLVENRGFVRACFNGDLSIAHKIQSYNSDPSNQTKLDILFARYEKFQTKREARARERNEKQKIKQWEEKCAIENATREAERKAQASQISSVQEAKLSMETFDIKPPEGAQWTRVDFHNLAIYIAQRKNVGAVQAYRAKGVQVEEIAIDGNGKPHDKILTLANEGQTQIEKRTLDNNDREQVEQFTRVYRVTTSDPSLIEYLKSLKERSDAIVFLPTRHSKAGAFVTAQPA